MPAPIEIALQQNHTACGLSRPPIGGYRRIVMDVNRITPLVVVNPSDCGNEVRFSIVPEEQADRRAERCFAEQESDATCRHRTAQAMLLLKRHEPSTPRAIAQLKGIEPHEPRPSNGSLLVSIAARRYMGECTNCDKNR